MFKKGRVREGKKALLTCKEKLLEELKYYKARINEVNNKRSQLTYYDDDSDSETELTIGIDTGPSVTELKLQRSMLQTCLQATQELTSLHVLQSEINIVSKPDNSTEKEEGVWREVTAECRIDLVPFSITFFTHQPHRKFAPATFHDIRVQPVKRAHEAELEKSVLPDLASPSDAVEVLRSYAQAHRSRRTTLARLVDTFGNRLHMEPIPSGGFILKCADLLEISWLLQSKTSPLAPFHHKMKFDLEYMDESYIKTITSAHKQLSDPTLTTDERTNLLIEIIKTCLQAKGPTQDVYDSMESDAEVAQSLRGRRTTLDRDIAENVGSSNDRFDDNAGDILNSEGNDEEQVMAPPKTIPKKAKGKENKEDNRNKKSLKRSSEVAGKKAKNAVDDAVQAKKPKTAEKDVKDKKTTVMVSNEAVGKKSKSLKADSKIEKTKAPEEDKGKKANSTEKIPDNVVSEERRKVDRNKKKDIKNDKKAVANKNRKDINTDKNHIQDGKKNNKISNIKGDVKSLKTQVKLKNSVDLKNNKSVPNKKLISSEKINNKNDKDNKNLENRIVVKPNNAEETKESNKVTKKLDKVTKPQGNVASNKNDKTSNVASTKNSDKPNLEVEHNDNFKVPTMTIQTRRSITPKNKQTLNKRFTYSTTSSNSVTKIPIIKRNFTKNTGNTNKIFSSGHIKQNGGLLNTKTSKIPQKYQEKSNFKTKLIKLSSGKPRK